MADKHPSFKPYYQDQFLILPPKLEELIPKQHPFRIVKDVINKINLEPLLEGYHIKGGSNYHPQMLLKVLVYGYLIISTPAASWKKHGEKRLFHVAECHELS